MAPFVSDKQRRFLFKFKPKIAREFAGKSSHNSDHNSDHGSEGLPRRKKDLNRRIMNARKA